MPLEQVEVTTPPTNSDCMKLKDGHGSEAEELYLSLGNEESFYEYEDANSHMGDVYDSITCDKENLGNWNNQKNI